MPASLTVLQDAPAATLPCWRIQQKERVGNRRRSQESSRSGKSSSPHSDGVPVVAEHWNAADARCRRMGAQSARAVATSQIDSMAAVVSAPVGKCSPALRTESPLRARRSRCSPLPHPPWYFLSLLLMHSDPRRCRH